MAAIKLRKLGNTGLELSTLTVGTWGLCAGSYGRVFPEQRSATLARALDQGVTTFDMAPTWGADGAAESAVRDAAGARRSELIYITRVGFVASDGYLAPAFAAGELRAQCEASLRRLGTEHIDVLLLQHPSADQLREHEVHATMEALLTEGKIRAWGASVSHAEDARAALVSGAQVLCMPFNLLQPELVWDLASECKERGTGILARSVLLHGLLSGRWGEKKRFPPDDHRMFRWSHDALAARVRQANDYKQRVDAGAPSMSTLALQFVLAHEEVASAMFGPRTPAQLVAATEALASELKLSVADLQFLSNSIR